MKEDTIVAVATPPGTGGIAGIRISGPDAIACAGKIWRGKKLDTVEANTCVYGHVVDPERGETIDECMALVLRGPRSFTGEDTVEISCHGSRWIQRTIVKLAIKNGARGATGGEFSRRAFLNGKIDLAQAEGIADLISASSRAAHRLAMSQAGGRFSRRLEELRGKLTDFASLLELELDFSEEDVEFADRTGLLTLGDEIHGIVTRLAATFESGSAFKDGVEVVIAGLPNAGKSTLLNALLDEDKAIVSDIPGTTRDMIEETREIGGILFRFVDTAGLRESTDTIENMGIDRARTRLSKAPVIVWVEDLTGTGNEEETERELDRLKSTLRDDAATILFRNKSDILAESDNSALGSSEQQRDRDRSACASEELSPMTVITGSASAGDGLPELRDALVAAATSGHNPAEELMVTNVRHYECLTKGGEALARGMQALRDGLPTDLVAQDIREALHHIGQITGAITTDTLLQTIFHRFCIGK